MVSSTIKLNLSGEEITGMGAEETPMSRRGNCDGGAPRRERATSRSRPTHALQTPSSSASSMVSSTSTMPLSPMKRLWICSKPSKTNTFVAPGLGLADQHFAACRRLWNQTRLTDHHRIRTRTGNGGRYHAEDAQARHPRADRRRLWLCLDTPGNQRNRHPYLCRSARNVTHGGDPGGHKVRRARSWAWATS